MLIPIIAQSYSETRWKHVITVIKSKQAPRKVLASAKDWDHLVYALSAVDMGALRLYRKLCDHCCDGRSS